MPQLISASPQAPEDVVVRGVSAGPDEVTAAAVRARAVGRDWSRLPGPARAAALQSAAAALGRRAREVEDLIVREVGKPRGEARGEVVRAEAILAYYAQQVLDPLGETYPPSAAGLLYTERRPRGLAGLITPWNFPIAIPLWKAAPALAAGNAVLLKPSTQGLACAQLLAEVIGEGLPPGLFAVLPGERETAEALIAESDVVSFTGSTVVGRQVALAAVRRGIPVQSEMGGQNPAIVLPDADLQRTAAHLVAASMGFAGQKCTATRRIIVVGDPGPLLEALEAELPSARPGDPDDSATAVGPVITEAARGTVLDAVALAKADGARVVDVAGPRDGGWYVAPTVISGLPGHHPLLQEETFGPVAAVLSAASRDEAVHLANGVRYGLVSSIHGRDLDEVLATVRELETGMVKVNAPATGVDYYLPFGGDKSSSIGPREQGKAAMAFYSSTRTVTIASG